MVETPTKADLQEKMKLGYSLPLMKIQVSYLQKTIRDSRQRVTSDPSFTGKGPNGKCLDSLEFAPFISLKISKFLCFPQCY